jgi:YhcH/YjgK/YiaL family protein
MLLFPLTEAAAYAHVHPLFPLVFAWLAEPANRAIADGRHPLQGDDLLVIAESGITHASADRRFESHRRYCDIQVSLSGGEVMEWTPVAGLVTQLDFQEGGDIAFYDQPHRPVTRLAVLPDHAAVFFPADAHKPVLHLGAAAAAYRKLVFKVALAARTVSSG